MSASQTRVLAEAGPIPSLAEYTDEQERILRAMVAAMPEGQEDLPPMFCFVDAKGRWASVPVAWRNAGEKDEAIAFFHDLLRSADAVLYAIIAASWQVILDKNEPGHEELVALANKYGTGHPRLLKRRAEIYSIVTGDSERSLITMLKVTRNKAKRITKLDRLDVSQRSDNMLSGRMADLLARPKH
jgi:hypothetical protein